MPVKKKSKANKKKPKPRCSTNPHLFSGRDIVDAPLTQNEAPEYQHFGKIEACSNAAVYSTEPHYVCSGCCKRAQVHIRDNGIHLVAGESQRYLPFCTLCSDKAKAANVLVPEEGCVCGKEGWLRFQCKTEALDVTAANTDSEVESRTRLLAAGVGYLRPVMVCHCGAEVDEQSRVLKCAGCMKVVIKGSYMANDHVAMEHL